MNPGTRRGATVLAAFAAMVGLTACLRTAGAPGASEHPSAAGQDAAAAAEKSKGCLSCHQGIEDDHANKVARLGCVDCHGGDAAAAEKDLAHVLPNDARWRDRSTVTPSDKTEWLRLNADFV